MSKRQACVEITEEMIKAGARALSFSDLDVDWRPSYRLEECVKEVFLAMIEASSKEEHLE